MADVYLASTNTAFVKETQWLLECYKTAEKELTPLFTANNHSMTVEMAVIRLHDAWVRYCRELIIMSAGCNPINASGVRIPYSPGINNRSQVVSQWKSSFSRPPLFEPHWGSAADCIRVASILRVNNLSTIAAALGAVNSPAEEIRRVRNFFAHRNFDTQSKVKTHPPYSTVAVMNALELVIKPVPPGVSRFENWIAGLRLVASAAIQ